MKTGATQARGRRRPAGTSASRRRRAACLFYDDGALLHVRPGGRHDDEHHAGGAGLVRRRRRRPQRREAAGVAGGLGQDRRVRAAERRLGRVEGPGDRRCRGQPDGQRAEGRHPLPGAACVSIPTRRASTSRCRSTSTPTASGRRRAASPASSPGKPGASRSLWDDAAIRARREGRRTPTRCVYSRETFTEAPGCSGPTSRSRPARS